uniref:VCBS repeat-containing protein n=1 Tax=Schlesneria paludicola TaxID=360056 RepID=A0A7C4QQJ6_9PLAN
MNTAAKRIWASAGCLLWLGLLGCQSEAPPSSSTAVSSAPVVPAEEQAVRQFCGACHLTPRPDSFVKREWRPEVEQGYRFHLESGRLDLLPPPQEAVIAYFEGLAPERFAWNDPLLVSATHRPSPLAFTAETISAPVDTAAAIARIDRPRSAPPNLLFLSDMRGGRVWAWDRGKTPPRMRWTVPHPAAVVTAALGPQPTPGALIADLGSFLPEDHHRGGVWWAAWDRPEDLQPLISGLGRVSHLSVGDLDADGDDDLIVSVFGWHKTGGLFVYWNEAPQGTWPHLRPELLDSRPGALRAEICDLDGDGTPEIVCAFAQEHETLDVYRRQHSGGFTRTLLYRAPDPSWGSSDFVIVDLDRDGRSDVLMCYGDSFDGGDLRPYHGITWLRQEPEGRFEDRRLAGMPGVHRAVPADLDLDGDLDLAAVALLPESILQDPARPRLASVVWFEQTEGARFVPHVLEWNTCQHATCEVLDADGDGDEDILAGHYHWSGDAAAVLTLFRNSLRSSTASPQEIADPGK